MWASISNYFHTSLTVAWAHALAVLGLGMEALNQFPDVAQNVGLSSIIPPKYFGMYTIGIAGLTLLARLRTARTPTP
jgi:hypothetical protein